MIAADDEEEAWQALLPWRGLRAPGRLEAVDPEDLRRRADDLPRAEVLGRYTMAADADALVAAYRPLVEEVGADVVTLQVTSLHQEETIALLGAEVLPRLRGLAPLPGRSPPTVDGGRHRSTIPLREALSPAVLLGLVAGFQGGLFGVGGGLVMVPGMVLFLAIPQHRAHATSLAAMIFSTSAAVIPLAMDNRIDWDTAGFLVAGSMVGAYLGARLFSRIPEVWLAGGFMVLALASAVRMLLERDTAGAAATGTPTIDTWWLGIVGFVLIGFGAGVLGALMGVGGRHRERPGPGDPLRLRAAPGPGHLAGGDHPHRRWWPPSPTAGAGTWTGAWP